KNSVCAFLRVNLRIGELELQNAIAELSVLELRPKENPIDTLVFRPVISFHRTHLLQERTHVLRALSNFGWRIIGQPIVPGVKSGLTATNRIILIAPRIVIIGELV